jgi:penicillin amidase
VGPFVGVDFIDGYRLARIVEALEEREDWDVETTMALQVDQVCLPWREMREIVLGVQADDRESQQALQMLGAWDGVLRAESAVAALYEVFMSEIARRIAQARAPRSWLWALGRVISPVVGGSMLGSQRAGFVVRLLREQPEGWFGDAQDVPAAQRWAREIAAALGAAYKRLEDRLGVDPARWAWGAVRPLTMRHSLGRRRPLDRVYNLGPVSYGGDTYTINQATTNLSDPLRRISGNASLRMVVDVGAWEKSRYVLPGGQSGNPLSPHYGDQFELWLRGEGVPIAWSEGAVQAATRAVLRLEPGDDG